VARQPRAQARAALQRLRDVPRDIPKRIERGLGVHLAVRRTGCAAGSPTGACATSSAINFDAKREVHAFCEDRGRLLLQFLMCMQQVQKILRALT
jgi:hypothetical protein